MPISLPVAPPLAPMLARLARELPEGNLLYEPKWDGFRCLACFDGAAVDLRSRHDRPLARYFPEVARAVAALPRPAVLDGELVIPRAGGLAFEPLLARLHPSPTRVALLAGAPAPLRLTPATRDPAAARGWLAAPRDSGIDGVVAKPLALPYVPGRRGWIKVKQERTADCVVGGFRAVGGAPLVASLLLGLWDEADRLVHVGVSRSCALEQLATDPGPHAAAPP